jgi:phosphotransferase system  glucose/maltose/N-acetylglucosamine-specific IIC component
MEWVLLFVLAILVAMGLLAGQTYITPKFSQLQSAQAQYAGNVLVTAIFIFFALIIAGMALHLVDKKVPAVPTA